MQLDAKTLDTLAWLSRLDIPEEETEAPEPEGPAVTALQLSRDKMTLTVGSGSVLYATVNAEVGGEDVTVRWTNSN